MSASPSVEAGESSSPDRLEDHPPQFGFETLSTTSSVEQPATRTKRKRNLLRVPDPDTEVIALSPRALLATHRFVCEVCGKGFQRDQNLQLHRRGHNLPWKLPQRTNKESKRRVYVCPEPTCVHHDAERALGDLTGIKKHFCRKHGEKKWKCDQCSKLYAVQSDWKAHLKACGKREYRCSCGALYARRESFITHRAFCDILAEENARLSAYGQSGCSHKQGVGAEPNGMGDRPSVPHRADSQLSKYQNTSLPSSSEQEGLTSFSLMDSGIPPHSSMLVQGGLQTSTPNRGHEFPWTGSATLSGALPEEMAVMDGGAMVWTTRRMNDVSYLSEVHDNMHAKIPLSSSNGKGLFVNLLSPQGVDSQDASFQNGLLGLSATESRNHECRSGHPSAMSGLSSATGSGTPPNSNSSFTNPQCSTGPHMSATALLQKAAQMGAISSSGLWFGRFQSDIALQQKGTKQGGMDVFANSDGQPQSQQANNSVDSLLGARNFSAYEGRADDGSSTVQQFMNSLAVGGGLFGGMGASLLGLSNGVKGCMQHREMLFEHHMHGNRSEKVPDSHSSVSEMPVLLKPNFQKHDEGDARTTLDFLGTGSATGPITGIGHTLSQKDLTSLTSLNVGHRDEPFS